MPDTVTDTWTCPRCARPTSVTGARPDVAAALDAVRDHHAGGHRAADTMTADADPPTRPLARVRPSPRPRP